MQQNRCFSNSLARIPLHENGANSKHPSIIMERGDAYMVMTEANHVENLAFAHWQHSANEKAYEARLITKAMYELARDELQKTIESLSKLCYNV